MTPAEKPRAIDRNFVFVDFVKNARTLPIPVASPANNVSPKANNTFSSILHSPFRIQQSTLLLGLGNEISISKKTNVITTHFCFQCMQKD